MVRLGYDLTAPLATALAFACALAGCTRAPEPAAPEPDEATAARIESAVRAAADRRYDDAQTHYERARAEAPDGASRAYASREHARALIARGENDRAIRALEDAVAAVPRFAAAWHDLGILRYQAGRTEGARLALGRAKRLRPRDPRPVFALAAIDVNAGDYDRARERYRRLLELDLPADAKAAVREALELLDSADNN